MTLQYAPNPFSKNLRVQAPSAFHYKIYTLTGHQIEAGFCTGDCTLSKNLVPGTYLFSTWSKTQSRTIKIIKK
ncbi:hypothetical protein AHMF7605_14985 [Adhaeribacter arboris]|uniref:Secretion system C-terminal sorting domain-containing protein n=1 Tax=Adhaeribacter arboris TaxID=2072846 RepID=A0A2T2YGS2_9BACT|nr:T9SS type A sorting domain-containing protein [Adhaeribacter arboris]PSR54717.1 hypothetical protein AHMF7605_14985 [Adhaeribacter arboris]